MKNLLGGKGANLAEMAGHKALRLPVPPGFTITTEVCTHFMKTGGKYPAGSVNALAEERLIRMVQKMREMSAPPKGAEV